MSTYVPGRDNFIASIRFGDAAPLFDFADDSVGERIRYDYENTVSDLFIDNYLGGFAEWAWERGLATHSQTFGMPVDTIRSAQYVDLPDTESLYAGGTLDFLKLTGSAAALHGRSIAGGEFLTLDVTRLHDLAAQNQSARRSLFCLGDQSAPLPQHVLPGTGSAVSRL